MANHHPTSFDESSTMKPHSSTRCRKLFPKTSQPDRFYDKVRSQLNITRYDCLRAIIQTVIGPKFSLGKLPDQQCVPPPSTKTPKTSPFFFYHRSVYMVLWPT